MPLGQLQVCQLEAAVHWCFAPYPSTSPSGGAVAYRGCLPATPYRGVLFPPESQPVARFLSLLSQLSEQKVGACYQTWKTLMGKALLLLLCDLLLPYSSPVPPARTWSWRHLKRPWASATLHPDKICWRLTLLLPHRGQPTSSPNHRVRFRGHGRVS